MINFSVQNSLYSGISLTGTNPINTAYSNTNIKNHSLRNSKENYLLSGPAHFSDIPKQTPLFSRTAITNQDTQSRPEFKIKEQNTSAANTKNSFINKPITYNSFLKINQKNILA